MSATHINHVYEQLTLLQQRIEYAQRKVAQAALDRDNMRRLGLPAEIDAFEVTFNRLLDEDAASVQSLLQELSQLIKEMVSMVDLRSNAYVAFHRDKAAQLHILGLDLPAPSLPSVALEVSPVMHGSDDALAHAPTKGVVTAIGPIRRAGSGDKHKSPNSPMLPAAISAGAVSASASTLLTPALDGIHALPATSVVSAATVPNAKTGKIPPTAKQRGPGGPMAAGRKVDASVAALFADAQGK